MPITQIAVITMISATVRRDDQRGVLGQRVQRRPSAARTGPPTLASEPTTSTPVIPIAQPPIQPNHGPMARVTQENVVPQSWSALLR